MESGIDDFELIRAQEPNGTASTIWPHEPIVTVSKSHALGTLHSSGATKGSLGNLFAHPVNSRNIASSLCKKLHQARIFLQ